MENRTTGWNPGIEERYARAKRKRKRNIIATISLLALAVVGYVSMSSERPIQEEFFWIPINLGTYAVLGAAVSYLVILLIFSIAAFVVSLRSGGFLAAIIVGVLSLGIGVTIMEQVVVLFTEVISFEKLFEASEFLSKPVVGPSEIVGVAIITSILYTGPLIVCFIMAVHWCRVCRNLKVPAEEARTMREESERQQAEEREKRRWEKRERTQKKENFAFFANCTTREKLDARYKSLMRAYHPDTQSGDEEIAKIINEQYEKKKGDFGK